MSFLTADWSSLLASPYRNEPTGLGQRQVSFVFMTASMMSFDQKGCPTVQSEQERIGWLASTKRRGIQPEPGIAR